MVISTPAGRLSFFNSSTVLCVGSMISIRRCASVARTSPVIFACGCGDRRTVNRSHARPTDGTGDDGAGAFDGIRDVAGRLVDDPVVKGLEAN